MTEIKIRRAAVEDWQAVRDIRLAALQEAPFAFGSTYARERDFDEATWKGRLSNADSPTFIAYDEDGPVGIDGLYSEGDDYHLVAMWVAPAARQQGVAAALTTAAIEWARHRGAPRVTLGVAENNEAARRVYERLGFRLTGNSEPLHSDPSRQTIEMALDLSAAP
jgi:ribosomal protein S18 acetylase RimI-like enzyme